MRKRRAIVGIEAAIVLIAFVIVAAALAFVALNMGLFTTQKSKETIQRGLGEASSALEVDGSVTGYYDATAQGVTVVVVPVKVAPGREAVDLSQEKVTVRLIAGGEAFEDIYTGPVTGPLSDYGITTLSSQVTGDTISPEAKVVFITDVSDTDNVLEFGEKALLVVELPQALGPYQEITIEIKPPEGAPLTVERMIPASLPSTSGAVNLG